MTALLFEIEPQIGPYIEQASAVDQETAYKRDKYSYVSYIEYVLPPCKHCKLIACFFLFRTTKQM